MGGSQGGFVRPTTINEAVEALGVPNARILAGGTDFYPALGEKPISGVVVDISAVRGLDQIQINEDHIRIGGRTTWTQIIAADLPRCFDALKLAAKEVGSVQIQNAASIAGNLCNASPAADGVPPLLILDAAVELTSRAGRRQMPLSEFITGNRRTQRRVDRLLTAVIVPRTRDDAASTFLKLGSRKYLVISISMIAASLSLDRAGKVGGASIAVGSCSAVAQRLPALEKALVGAPAGRSISDLVLPEHLAPLSPIDDVRATAAYRREASLTLVKRALEICAAGQ